jgi:uncharacterized protein (DUF2236 family)
VRAVHARVAGTTEIQLGRFAPGTPYSASDPELMLWVHTTLVQCSLQVYERFVRPLGPEDEERYYREMALVAELFGTPASVIPRALADFREYLMAELAGPRLAVTRPAREVAAVLHEANLPAPMRVLVPAHRLATAGLLPVRLREEYGLRWTPLHELALPLAARSVRRRQRRFCSQPVGWRRFRSRSRRDRHRRRPEVRSPRCRTSAKLRPPSRVRTGFAR